MTRALLEWEYNGLNLSKHAYNIKALGVPEIVPVRRGQNYIIPHKTGRERVYKFYDERVLPLTMIVKGSPRDGGVQSGSQLWSNLEVLKALFGDPGLHWLKVKAANNIVRQANVEVINQITFQPEGPDHYVFVVEFAFPDVWWENASPASVGPISLTTSPQNITINNEGTYEIEKAIITIHGDISYPKLTTVWEGVSCYTEWQGYASHAHTLVINCGLFSAMRDTLDYSGLIVNSNSPFWVPIPPGIHSLVVSGTFGTSPFVPTIQIAWTPVFI